MGVFLAPRALLYNSAELDVNPLVVHPCGAVAIDARVGGCNSQGSTCHMKRRRMGGGHS